MTERAAVVSIEIASRQKYLFETDKLQEMLGASRLMDESGQAADATLKGVHVFQPVSGEIRAWAPLGSRSALLAGTWRLRRWLTERGIEHSVAYLEVDESHLTTHCADETAGQRPDLRRVHGGLSQEGGRVKGLRPGPDARPTCAFFAPCRLHGHDATNHWLRESAYADPHDPRREQVGFRAAHKRNAWRDAKDRFYRRSLLEPVWRRVQSLTGHSVDLERAITFADLAEQLDCSEDKVDRVLAFICADGDSMSRVLPKLDWNDPRWLTKKSRRQPWEINREFVRELNECYRSAFAQAVAEVSVPDNASAEMLIESTDPVLKLPVLPQLLGGDDLWAVARRDVALALCQAFGSHFARLLQQAANGQTSATAIVQKALALAFPDGPPPLTVSFGVAFAKAGHPVHSMVAAAERLLAEAKSLRKGEHHRGTPALREGCVDWYWIESSLVEPVDDARSHGLRYHDTSGAVVELTSLPWTLGQSTHVIEAAREFCKGIHRRKIEQLDSVLRRGVLLSRLAFEGWWTRLDPRERDVFLRVNIAHLSPAGVALNLAGGVPDPWLQGAPQNFYFTPLLDLVRLRDVLNIRHEDDADEEF